MTSSDTYNEAVGRRLRQIRKQRGLSLQDVQRLSEGGRQPFKCTYRCLRTCNPAKAPYCIARALRNAILGDIDNAIIFAGSNVSRIDRILSVRELIDEIVTEAARELGARDLVAA